MTKQPIVENQVQNAELKERRHIFNGEPTVTPSVAAGIRTNRKLMSRRRSPVTWLFILALISGIVVFYIWNKITVDKVTKEIAQLEKEHRQVANTNEILRAEINQKSRLERVGRIATDQLGLIYPKEQPVWFQMYPQLSNNGKEQ